MKRYSYIIVFFIIYFFNLLYSSEYLIYNGNTYKGTLSIISRNEIFQNKDCLLYIFKFDYEDDDVLVKKTIYEYVDYKLNPLSMLIVKKYKNGNEDSIDMVIQNTKIIFKLNQKWQKVISKPASFYFSLIFNYASVKNKPFISDDSFFVLNEDTLSFTTIQRVMHTKDEYVFGDKFLKYKTYAIKDLNSNHIYYVNYVDKDEHCIKNVHLDKNVTYIKRELAEKKIIPYINCVGFNYHPLFYLNPSSTELAIEIKTKNRYKSFFNASNTEYQKKQNITPVTYRLIRYKIIPDYNYTIEGLNKKSKFYTLGDKIMQGDTKLVKVIKNIRNYFKHGFSFKKLEKKVIRSDLILKTESGNIMEASILCANILRGLNIPVRDCLGFGIVMGSIIPIHFIEIDGERISQPFSLFPYDKSFPISYFKIWEGNINEDNLDNLMGNLASFLQESEFFIKYYRVFGKISYPEELLPLNQMIGNAFISEKYNLSFIIPQDFYEFQELSDNRFRISWVSPPNKKVIIDLLIEPHIFFSKIMDLFTYKQNVLKNSIPNYQLGTSRISLSEPARVIFNYYTMKDGMNQKQKQAIIMGKHFNYYFNIKTENMLLLSVEDTFNRLIESVQEIEE